MKKLYSIALFLISLSVVSQTPGLINYQGVARLANGDPIVGTIGVSVTIHVGGPGGAAVLTEQHAVNTNQFGIFEVRIGSNSPGVLTNIPWGVSSYWLGVAIDAAGGTNYGTEISNQRLLSVPYALYAEKSGSSSPGGSLTASPNVTVTTSGTNTFNINVPNYVAGTNVTITPLTGNNFQINAAGNTATSIPTGPWNSTIGNVFLSSPSDNVGIGTSGPAAKLEVSANPFSTNNAIAAYAIGGNGVLALTSSTLVSSAAVSAQNSGSGNGVYGSAVSTSATVAGVRGQNMGAGPGVFGINNNGSTSGSANGVYGETNAMTNVAAGVQGSNFGMGAGVYGWQGPANGGPGVFGVANSSLSAGVYGTNSNLNNAYAGVMGEITSGSSSGSASGVLGRTNSSNVLSSGVYGYNTGAGSGVYGLASANTFSISGVVGKNIGFGMGVYGEANSTSNIVGAVTGFNQGMGPALKGSLPTSTLAGGSNAALLIENGHIWATSVNPPVITATVNNTGATVLGASLTPGSNDVRGMITVTVQSNTAPWVAFGNYEITLQFNKQYQAGGPWVVCSKYDESNTAVEVKTMTTTFVVFRIKNPLNVSISPSGVGNVLRFNYMVMQ